MTNRRAVSLWVSAAVLCSLGACDLRPPAEASAPPVMEPEPTPELNAAGNTRPEVPLPPPQQRPELVQRCPDGPPKRLIVERAGARTMDVPTEELGDVRGVHKAEDGRFRGRLLIPLSALGAKKLEVVPCAGDPAQLVASDRIALTPNKRGHLKMVSLDSPEAPLMKNIALVRVLE